MEYLESATYKETYGDHKVWELYRRNINGRRPFSKTRKTCIIDDRLEGGNPCPICRDEYLVVDYRNLKLLEQFVSAYNGQIYSWKTTNLCQDQHKNIIVAIEKARDYGYLDIDVAHISYDYDKYKPDLSNSA